MGRLQETDERLLEARDLGVKAEGIQEERELSVGREQIDQPVDASNRWSDRDREGDRFGVRVWGAL